MISTGTFPRIARYLVIIAFSSPPSIGQEAANQSRFHAAAELGALSFDRSKVRVPADNGTEFDMRAVTGESAEAFVRLSADWEINPKHAVGLVIAPLEVSGTGSLPTETLFAGRTFAAGPVNGSYDFSIYKLSYRYTLEPRGDWQWRIGFTGLIRDANIALHQGDLQANYDNAGFAPLFHVSAEYRLSNRWRFFLDFDGLAGGPGRAFDIALKATYDIDDHWWIGGGYRLLEGGVDNDDVYNFAWVNYALIDLGYRF